MNAFRNDPHWQEYWSRRERNESTYLYSFVPFLQTAEILLRAATPFWYAWSPQRISDVQGVVQYLEGCTERLRDRGLPLSKAGVCPSFKHYHDHPSEQDEYPDAARFLVTIATHMLFVIFPLLQKYAREHSMGMKWLDSQLAQRIEILAESPLFDRDIKVPVHSLRTLIEYGALLECEGIAYAMARIDGAFKKDTSPKRAASLSERELQRLADEIGVSFETVKEVFERTHSSWWETSESYKNAAHTMFERFLSEQGMSEEMLVVFRTHKPPMVTDSGHQPYISDQEERDKNERVANTFIALFLAHAHNPEQEAPQRSLPRAHKVLR